MKIGITFDLKNSAVSHVVPAPSLDPPPPDDLEEEYDSPATVNAIAEALRSFGHEVELLGDGEPLLRKLLAGPRPELVFNIAEGFGVGRGREARVPALLEMLGIPYTGSDVLTLAATLDKDCAKRLVRSAGVVTPDWALIQAQDDPEACLASFAPLQPPFIVKPAFEGSSKGIRATSLVKSRGELVATVRRLLADYRQEVLVEEYIDGAELTVGVLARTSSSAGGGQEPDPIGILQVLPRRPVADFIYSLEVKRDWENQVEYLCPPRLPESDCEAVRRAAVAAWRVLGCRDVSRFDFRLRAGVPYFLEVNPLPGLSPSSGDIVILSHKMGLGYRELIGRILEAALVRVRLGRV